MPDREGRGGDGRGGAGHEALDAPAVELAALVDGDVGRFPPITPATMASTEYTMGRQRVMAVAQQQHFQAQPDEHAEGHQRGVGEAG